MPRNPLKLYCIKRDNKRNYLQNESAILVYLKYDIHLLAKTILFVSTYDNRYTLLNAHLKYT